MKTYTLKEVQDELIEVIGTPDRERFEAELHKTLEKKVIMQLQRESPMNGQQNSTNRIAQ